MTKAAELAALIGSQTAQTGRNMAYNGAMNVAQRGTSSTGIGASSGYFTVDRFKLAPNGTAGRLTMTQTAITDLPGFANALKLDCTTADTSVAAAEFLILSQYFEGQDLQRLKKGTSEAESITISFYVKGNAAATYTVEIYDADNNRSNNRRFSVTTSWNRVSLTYEGDTTGALDDDNAASLIVNIWLHAGSDSTSGTQNTAWQTLAAAERANSDDTSFFDSTDRTFFMTGFQMEIGETATPFQHEDIGTTLRKCQRYYYQLGPSNATSSVSAGMVASANSVYGSMNFPVTMRTAPTGLTTSGTATDYDVRAQGSVAVSSAVPSFHTATPDTMQLFFTSSGGNTTGDGSILRLRTTSGFIGTSGTEL